MCFRIHRKHGRKLIAEKDIECYKIVYLDEKKRIQSSVQGFIYKFGMRYDLGGPLYRSSFQDRIVDEGFHSYTVLEKVKTHALKNLRSHKQGSRAVKCTIPAGSEYYYNPEYKEYVSNSIIINDYLYVETS